MKNLMFYFQIIIPFVLIISCKNNCKEDCNKGCTDACEVAFTELCEEDFVAIVDNFTDDIQYKPKTETEEDIIFNIDLRNTSFQPVHFEACRERAFAVLAKFKGNMSRRYNCKSVALEVRNIFAIGDKFLKVAEIEEMEPTYNKKGKPYINLNVVLEKADFAKDSVFLPLKKNVTKSIRLKKLNKIKKNTGLDLHLFFKEGNGTIIEFPHCRSQGQIKIKDFGGRACKGNLSY